MKDLIAGARKDTQNNRENEREREREREERERETQREDTRQTYQIKWVTVCERQADRGVIELSTYYLYAYVRSVMASDTKHDLTRECIFLYK